MLDLHTAIQFLDDDEELISVQNLGFARASLIITDLSCMFTNCIKKEVL
jgi:hypothetical protein